MTKPESGSKRSVLLKLFPKESVPFTQVANDVLNNPSLSYKAKGVFAYLFSKPEGWSFSRDRIAQDSTDGTNSVRSALIELEQAGYLKRVKHSSGRMDYQMLFSKPPAEKANQAKSQPGETIRISNIDSGNNKDPGNKKEGTLPFPPYELIWQAYPAARRQARRPAFTSIRHALKRSGMTADDMLRVVKRFARLATDEPPAFVPMLTTWMNQDRYELKDDDWFPNAEIPRKVTW